MSPNSDRSANHRVDVFVDWVRVAGRSYSPPPTKAQDLTAYGFLVGQDACVAVVGVAQDQVDLANRRLAEHFAAHVTLFAFDFWVSQNDPSHTEAFMNCPQRWFASDYPRGHWPEIAPFLEAAVVAWPTEQVWYYSDAGAPSDGLLVTPPMIDDMWKVWEHLPLHREKWSSPRGVCSHNQLELSVESDSQGLPVSRPSLYAVLSCGDCFLNVEAPITPSDVETVSAFLESPELVDAFVHVLSTAEQTSWGHAAGVIAATKS